MTEPERLRVLVVDDEEIIASTLSMILRLSGFASDFFTNPIEALHNAEIIAPDFLISDVIMPRMTGIELAIGIQEICPNCKVLLFSGQEVTLESLRIARIIGHDFQFLQKPVHPTELLAAIRSQSDLHDSNLNLKLPHKHSVSARKRPEIPQKKRTFCMF